MKNATRPSTTNITIILGTLSAFGPMSIDMYLPGLPSIARQFAVPASAAQLTLTIFLIGLTVGQAFYGPIADSVGRKLPLLVGCSLYMLASVGCALSWSIGSLTAFRVLQAIGGCAGVVIPRSVVRDLFDPRDSAKIYSLLMLVLGLAPITAPLIGGQLLVAFGWRAIFVVLAGFGLVCVLMVGFGLEETLPASRRNSAGVSQAVRVYGGLLADRRFVGYSLTGGFVSASMFAYIAGSPFVFIELHGVAPQHYGWIFGTNALGLVLAAQLNHWLLKKHFRGDAILTTMLYIVSGSGLVVLLIASTGALGLPGLLVPMFVCIAGNGLIFPNAAAAAMAPHGKVAGSASALQGTLSLAVGAASGTLVGVLHNGTAIPMAGSMALCSISALVIYLTMADRPARRGSRPADGTQELMHLPGSQSE